MESCDGTGDNRRENRRDNRRGDGRGGFQTRPMVPSTWFPGAAMPHHMVSQLARQIFRFVLGGTSQSSSVD